MVVIGGIFFGSAREERGELGEWTRHRVRFRLCYDCLGLVARWMVYLRGGG